MNLGESISRLRADLVLYETMPHRLNGVVSLDALRTLLAAAEDSRRDEGTGVVGERNRFARNIVNQLFDAADVPVEVRQAINDECDEFVARVLTDHAHDHLRRNIKRRSMNEPTNPFRNYTDAGVAGALLSWARDQRERQSWDDDDRATYSFRANLLEAAAVRLGGTVDPQ